MILTEQERNSTTWTKMQAYLNDQLAKCHSEIAKNISAEDTANIRGRIRLIKQILSAAKATDAQK
jgi:hypothetical protein